MLVEGDNLSPSTDAVRFNGSMTGAGISTGISLKIGGLLEVATFPYSAVSPS